MPGQPADRVDERAPSGQTSVHTGRSVGPAGCGENGFGEDTGSAGRGAAPTSVSDTGREDGDRTCEDPLFPSPPCSQGPPPPRVLPCVSPQVDTRKGGNIFPAEQEEMVPSTREARAWAVEQTVPCKSHSEGAQRATARPPLLLRLQQQPLSFAHTAHPPDQTTHLHAPGKCNPHLPHGHTWSHSAAWPPSQACACAVGPQSQRTGYCFPSGRVLLRGAIRTVSGASNPMPSLPAPPAPCYTVGFSVVKYSIYLCLLIFN